MQSRARYASCYPVDSTGESNRVETNKSLNTEEMAKTFTPSEDYTVGCIKLFSAAGSTAEFDVFLTVDGEVWI